MSKISINQINGIPLHYARTTQHPYGSIGKQQDFLVEEDFHRELEKCFGELFLHCPLGEPKVLTCAGIFVNKSGQHGHAKAFDLDAIFWEDYSLIAKNFTQDAILYLGLESFYRKYFGVVLNHFYNASHEDHWHLDNSFSLSFDKQSRSKTLYVQLVLKHIYDKHVLVDGIWGPQTAQSVDDTFRLLGIDGSITIQRHWFKFLDLTGKVAFRLFEQNKTPLALINNVYAAIQDLAIPERYTLLESLNSFRFHPATDAWLGQYSLEQDIEAVIDEVKLLG